MENDDCSVLRPLSHYEASTTVHTRMITYPSFIRIIKMKVPFEKLKDGMELKSKYAIIKSDIEDGLGCFTETNIERSLRRTRKSIKDLILCNNFDAIASFTFNPDKVERFDVSLCKNIISNWIKNETKRKGKFEYLLVCEFHKKCKECVENSIKTCIHPDRPKAMHFHILFIGYTGKLTQAIDPKTGVELKGQYSIPSFTSGYTNYKRIEKSENSTYVALYLQKYITKDTPTIFGKNRYWASTGLRRPVITDNPEPWHLACKPDRQFENDFSYIEEFDVGKNPIVDMFWEVYKQ